MMNVFSQDGKVAYNGLASDPEGVGIEQYSLLLHVVYRNQSYHLQ